MYNLKKFLDNP